MKKKKELMLKFKIISIAGFVFPIAFTVYDVHHGDRYIEKSFKTRLSAPYCLNSGQLRRVQKIEDLPTPSDHIFQARFLILL